MYAITKTAKANGQLLKA